MKINDIERITGLTQKAIRLYEGKGLIKIARDENGYRNYKEEAATGAALFAAFAVGAIAYEDGFGDYVRRGEAL